jgi:translocation and assembly module TamA
VATQIDGRPAGADLAAAWGKRGGRRGRTRTARFGRVVALAILCSPIIAVSAELRYEAKIVGVDDSELADLLADVSQLKTLEDRLPASEEALRRRAEDDLPRLKEAAHSLGYWNAQFSYEIESGADPARVIVTAIPGPLYHVATVAIRGADGRPLARLDDGVAADLARPPLPLKPGDPARTAPVIDAENALLAALGHSGHPFAKAGEREVVVDHDNQTMAVTYTLLPGPVMRFGPATISGLDRLEAGYVEHRIRWRQGDAYDNRSVDETRKVLIESGLFSTVRITPVADLADPSLARINVEAVERAHRTIGVGLAYNTSEGAGGRVFWENRNLFGEAEYLRLSLGLGQQQKGAAANFRRPDFLDVDQDLLALAEIADDTPVAYHSRRARVSAGLERRFDRTLTGGIALGVEKANVVQLAILSTDTASQRTQHYALIGLPLYLKLDRSDDLLNPTSGYRAQANLVPYRSFSGPNLTFVFGRMSASAYRRLEDSDRYIIAGSAAVSSITGASLAALPADKRIYAGGGGSIRAYGYQMAGPLDFDKKPIGGKSSLELSLEARIKITESIGIVPFIDAGSFYPGSVPQPGRRLLFGPGLGFRYYTAFGPIRVDVATPIVRRSGDSLVQLYISLGQAF